MGFWRRLVLVWGLCGFAGATLAQPALAPWLPKLEDDPRTTLRELDDAVARATQPLSRVWLHRARLHAFSLLEETAPARGALQQALDERAALGADGAALDAWLTLDRLWIDVFEQAGSSIDAPLRQLAESAAAAGQPDLICEVQALQAWQAVAYGSLSDGWQASEALERCALSLGWPHQVAAARAAMARATVSGAGDSDRFRRADDFLQRAIAALGEPAPRFRSSLIEWDRARLLMAAGDWPAAATSLDRALALSRSLGDATGAAAVKIELAAVRVAEGRPAEALPLLSDAELALRAERLPARHARLAEQRVLALAALRRPEVIDVIAQARRDLSGGQLAPIGGRLERAIAAGYASQRRWEAAYEAQVESQRLDELARQRARDDQLQMLEQRFDRARRDADAAELRERHAHAELALRSEVARQRMLWGALALLAAAAVTTLVLLGGLVRRRRALSDLALKDPLTGAPNRRAVAAYGQAQANQARRLGLPLTVALVDLDHFKEVNDQHGHDAGDDLLRAFAVASERVLRGQDRFGRWGGEEWMLVMPGTRSGELSSVFERLRHAFAEADVPAIGRPHGRTFSMGCAELGADGSSFEELVRAADQRLYLAKHEGRDRLVASGSPTSPTSPTSPAGAAPLSRAASRAAR